MSRPRGCKNKTGTEVKEQMIACYHRLGGLEKFTKWAGANLGEFYRMYISLAPKEISADITVTRSEVDLTDDELAAIARGSRDSADETAGGEAQAPELH